MTDDRTVCRCCHITTDVTLYHVTVMVRSYSYHATHQPIHRALVLHEADVPICADCRPTVYAVPRLEAEEVTP